MSKKENHVHESLEEKTRLALEDYRNTIDIIIYEGTAYWQRFDVLFAVDAAILVFLGVVVGGSQPTISQNPDAQKILLFGICTIGFVSSVSMVFSCLRSQMFYRSWWKHIQKLEDEVLTGFSMMKDMDTYFKTQSFVRQASVMTLSLVMPITFSALFGILPALLFWQDAVLYLVFVFLVLVLLLVACGYSAWRRSQEYPRQADRPKVQ